MDSANIEYDYDYYEGRKSDVSISAEAVLDSRLTVCAGYARLAQALLQAQGIPAVTVTGLADGVRGWPTDGKPNHDWNLAYVDGRWIYMDTTWGSTSGGNSGNTNSDWFDPTELYFSLTHKGVSSNIVPNSHSGNGTPELIGATVGGFSDVRESDYYADAVLWAVDKGITSGTSTTTFSPDATCTTAQILTFLWRSQGQPEPTSKTNPFTDVKETDYYYKAALWAHEKGLVSGTALNGGTACTRSATVTYLWKLAGSPSASPATFTDVPSTADFSQAVAWAVKEGITSGTSSTTFSPEAVCSRGQIVTFLWRAYK